MGKGTVVVAKDARFAFWMEAVDSALVRRCGQDSMDLPDCSYRDWFDAGMTPGAAAQRVVREAREQEAL